MKTKLIALLPLALLTLFGACDKKKDLGPEELTLSATELTFSSAAQSQTLTLKSTIDWGIQGYTDEVKAWLSIDPESGSASAEEVTVTFTVLSNPDNDRSATLTFYGNVLHKQTITVAQNGDKGDAEALSVAEFISKKDTENEYKLTGKIGNISTGAKKYGFMLKDATGEVYCAFPTNFDEYKAQLRTGGTVTIKGKYSYYEQNKQDQMANGAISAFTAPDLSNIQSKTVKEFIEAADVYTLYRLSGKVTGDVDATYGSFDLKDASGQTIKVYSGSNLTEYKDKLKNYYNVTLVGAYQLYTSGTSSTHEVVDAQIETYSEDTPPVITGTVSDAVAQEDGTLVTVNGALVTAITTKGFIITDGSANAYVYMDKEHDVVIGDELKVNATKATYNGLPELKTPEYEIVSHNNPVNYPAVTDITAGFDAYASTTADYISFTGTLSTSKGNNITYYNLAVPGATLQGSISLPLASFGLDGMEGKMIKVTGYYGGLSSSKYHSIIAVAVELSDMPFLTVDKTAISVAASARTASFKVGGNASWTVSCDDAALVADPTSGSGEATVTLSFPENTDTENAKVYTVKVSTEDEAPVKEFTVVLTQKKASSGGGDTATYTLDFATATKDAVNDYTSSWKATCDDFTWTLTNFNNYKNEWAFVRCGRKNNASVASITTASVMPEAIEKVVITFDTFDASLVNSAKLLVDTAVDFSSAACQTINVAGAAGTVTVDIPAPAENCYYKLELDCKSGSKNGFIQISKVVYTNE